MTVAVASCLRETSRFEKNESISAVPMFFFTNSSVSMDSLSFFSLSCVLMWKREGKQIYAAPPADYCHSLLFIFKLRLSLPYLFTCTTSATLSYLLVILVLPFTLSCPFPDFLHTLHPLFFLPFRLYSFLSRLLYDHVW